MKLVLVLIFLAAVAFAEPVADPAPWYGYWGYPYYIKTGPKHTWVDGYGYAIVGDKEEPAAVERKKREADPAPWYYGYWGYPYGYYGRKTTWVDGYGYAITGRKKRESDPAVVGSHSSAPLQATPYLGHPLVGGVPHSATIEHKGTEVIPGAVAAGESIPGTTVYAGHYGYGLPFYGRRKREAEAEAEAEADPKSWYYGYYGHHLGYYGRYYGGYYGYPYGYGYYYGK